MDSEKQKNSRLIIFFFIGVILLNYPILSLFSDNERNVFGIPLLYAFVFTTWALLIFITALTVRYTGNKTSQHTDKAQ
ncbi:MAG: hypothetical protein H8E41_03900 [Desulfobulbaceae bacterium]|uniref:DUF3311 domain-containing protein n=1 Tax=Candidatus Desulfobia pelagia TaxID=2841692 RepID=A0A8J6NC37_9BACT|nr:hypothetical protein [Candidatus Desulfobia pelagia]